jgi:hypothetical protein
MGFWVEHEYLTAAPILAMVRTRDVEHRLCQKRCDAVDELLGGVDCRACAVEGYRGIWAQVVVGNRLQIVGLREKAGEVGKIRFILRQLRKQSMHPAVRLYYLAQTRADDGLRRMKAGEVSVSTGVFTNPGGKNDPGASETLAGFVEVLFSFRDHRSTPSRRISCIKEVRSR